MAHYWRAALAQLVEQLSCKQQVIGSSPIGGSTEKRPRADESRRGAFCSGRGLACVEESACGAFGPWPAMCSPSAVQGWCVGSCVVAGAGGLACPGVCVVAGAGGWPVRGFVLCAGYWRVWRKAMSGCWGAVVRRGWVSRVWGFLLCAGGVGVCGGKRCRVAGAPWYVAGGDNGVLGLGAQ